MARLCMKCGAVMRQGAKFCPACGVAAPVSQEANKPRMIFCMKCGAPLKDGVKFCMKCGSAVSQAAQEPRQNICTSCGAALKADMKFCMRCGAAVGQTPTVKIPVREPVISVTVSDTPPVPQTPRTEPTKKPSRKAAPAKANADGKQAERESETNPYGDRAKAQAASLAKKALPELLEQRVGASETAGEMRIPMTDAQKSCLTNIIRGLAKAAGR